MPKENVQRAINKAADKDAASLAETNYEGYATHGIAVFVECLTDNQQRTLSNIRSYFTKYSGSLGTKGSLNFIFDRKGIFTVHDDKPVLVTEFTGPTGFFLFFFF